MTDIYHNSQKYESRLSFPHHKFGEYWRRAPGKLQLGLDKSHPVIHAQVLLTNGMKSLQAVAIYSGPVRGLFCFICVQFSLFEIAFWTHKPCLSKLSFPTDIKYYLNFISQIKILMVDVFIINASSAGFRVTPTSLHAWQNLIKESIDCKQLQGIKE